MDFKLIQDNEHKINNDSFSLRKLQFLYSREQRGYDTKTGVLNDFTEAKKYMLRYLFPVEGGYMLNANGVLEFKSIDIINRTYLRPLNGKEYKNLKDWFISIFDIYRRVCIPNRQLIKDDTINVVGSFKHSQGLVMRNNTNILFLGLVT
jgi:hypothetical protein